MTNVVTLPNCKAGPNENLLDRARDGQIQSFIGTGFTTDGGRVATWVDHHSNLYEMLGSLAWLQNEYVHRHTEAIGG